MREERLDGITVDDYQLRVTGTLDIPPDIADLLRLDGTVVGVCTFRIGQAEFKVDEERGVARRKDVLTMDAILPAKGAAREQLLAFVKHGNPQGSMLFSFGGSVADGDSGETQTPPVEVDATTILQHGAGVLTGNGGKIVDSRNGERLLEFDNGDDEPETTTVEGVGQVDQDGTVVAAEPEPEPEPESPAEPVEYDDGFDPDEWAGADEVLDNAVVVGHVDDGPRYVDDGETTRKKTAAEQEKGARKVSYEDLLELGGDPSSHAAQPVGETVGEMRDYRGGTPTKTDELLETI